MVGQADSATTEHPPEDSLGRIVWRLDRFLRWPEDALNLIAATAILFLMLLGVVQVVLRAKFLFNAPIFGYIDMIELAMPVLAIIGISYCQRQGTHIRMDILMGRLTGRTLWSIETFAGLCTLVIAALLAWFAWNFFYDAYNIGDSTTDAEIDTWPSKLLVPLAFGLLVLRMITQTMGAARLAVNPDLTPVGVVVQKDIAEQAKEEIREAMGSDTPEDAR
ncbi:MAG: TRAP transporter small permease [Paracoccaceae bacterium]